MMTMVVLTINSANDILGSSLRISFATPARFFDIDLGLIILAEFKISSMVILPLCLMFLTFFLSLGGSFKALIIKAAAEGTTSTLA